MTYGKLQKLFDQEWNWDGGYTEYEQRQIFCDSDWWKETSVAYRKDGTKLTKTVGDKEVDLDIHSKSDMEQYLDGDVLPDKLPPEIFEGSTDRTSKSFAKKKTPVSPAMSAHSQKDRCLHIIVPSITDTCSNIENTDSTKLPSLVTTVTETRSQVKALASLSRIPIVS